MFSIFRTKKVHPPVSFSTLEVDLHSHLIPGIDDGTPDMETSLSLLAALQTMGFKKIITTPHIYSDLYPNTSEIIRRGLQDLREALPGAGLELEIDAAAEYFIDDHFLALVQQKDLLTLPGQQVLVEMSFLQESPQLHQALFQLQTKGYQPILAHPERYLYYKKTFDQYERLKELGCRLQVNVLSLVGYYGKPTREIAIRLVKEGLVDFLATDLHHQRHAQLLEEALNDQKLQEILRTHNFLNRSLLAPQS